MGVLLAEQPEPAILPRLLAEFSHALEDDVEMEGLKFYIVHDHV